MNQDTTAQSQLTDDPELAKVIDGINGGSDGSATLPTPASDGLQFEETPAPPTPVDPATQGAEAEPAAETAVETSDEDTAGPELTPDPLSITPERSSIPEVTVVKDQPVYAHDEPANTTDEPAVAAPTENNDLNGIKKHALEELRPLVDKLNLPAEEKFNTLLLIIRSTDDQTLLNSTYEAARLIEDENKRAQALLDVIKEIDFFTAQKSA